MYRKKVLILWRRYVKRPMVLFSCRLSLYSVTAGGADTFLRKNALWAYFIQKFCHFTPEIITEAVKQVVVACIGHCHQAFGAEGFVV